MDPSIAKARQELRRARGQEQAVLARATALRNAVQNLGSRAVNLATGESSLRSTAIEGFGTESIPASSTAAMPSREISYADAPKAKEQAAQRAAQRAQLDKERRARADLEEQRLRAAREKLEAEEKLLEQRRRDLGLELAPVPGGEGNEGAPVLRLQESASEIQERYRSTMEQQETELRALREKVSAAGIRPAREEGYAGELGASTYASSQLDAVKMGRTVAEELVDELVGELGESGHTMSTGRWAP